MSYHELNKIRNMVSNAANAVFQNEKLPVGVLAVKAAKLAQANPYDNTCVGMYRFLAKRAENGRNLFITRNEFRDVYNRLYSNNNKFGAPFKAELGLEEKSQVRTSLRDERENHMLSELHKHMDSNFDSTAYQAYAEELGSALENKAVKPYSSKTAKAAQRACARELNSIGLLPKKIAVVAGQDDLLICEALYETPKGATAALIPLEVKSGLAIPPSMFLTTNGFVNLTSENVTRHLRNTAGKTFTVDAQSLLKKIAEARQKTTRPVSEVERIVRKASLNRGTPVLGGANDVLLTEIDPAHPEVKLAAPQHTEESLSVAEHLNSKKGAAEFVHGRDAVDMARNMIAFELKRAGYGMPQVKVADSKANQITYAVAINNQLGFKANVKFTEDKKPVMPRVVIAAGMVYEFSKAGLDKMLESGANDADVLAETSPMYGLKPSDLVDQVRTAMAENNLDRAADALHVLKQGSDEFAYRTAYDIYVGGLRGETQEKPAGCSAPVKLGSSMKKICSHTGLPVDKIYQDKYGQCRPLYRRGMEDSSTEGVSTITNRIYFE
jgi:hypothetical protein